jgi:ParB family chromosome partitioning protein
LKFESRRSEKRPKKINQTYFSSLADDLSRHFGTRVEITKQGQKGKVEIDFYSDEDLDRIIRMIKKD